MLYTGDVAILICMWAPISAEFSQNLKILDHSENINFSLNAMTKIHQSTGKK